MEDVFRLITNKADPNEIKKQLKGKDLSAKDKYGQSILHHTCMAGLYDLAAHALKKGVPVNDADKNGWTAFHCAASGGHLRICEMLMKEGASSTAMSTDGGTPLHYLVRIPWDPVNSPKIFSPILIKQMGDVNALLNRQDESPLHQASMKGSEECVSFLLEQKADPNLRNKHGETPLHFAIRAGKFGIVRLLFEYGADASITGNQGSCLQLAQTLGIPGMVPEVEEGHARSSVRKDVNKVYKQGPVTKSGGAKGRKSSKKVWAILDGKSFVTCPSESEAATPPMESFNLKEASTIIMDEGLPNTFIVTLKNGVQWALTFDERQEMAKWLFGIDGLKFRNFQSCVDTKIKKTLLQQTYKDGYKGGIIKSSFDEEWMYSGDGTLTCSEGWTGPEFLWDGSELVSKSGAGKKDPLGWGRYNGFLFEWLDPDMKVVMRYWTEEMDREYLCEDPQKTWKWTRHFLALKHGTGEWIVENFVPEPVVFFLSLLRYRRLSLSS